LSHAAVCAAQARYVSVSGNHRFASKPANLVDTALEKSNAKRTF